MRLRLDAVTILTKSLWLSCFTYCDCFWGPISAQKRTAICQNSWAARTKGCDSRKVVIRTFSALYNSRWITELLWHLVYSLVGVMNYPNFLTLGEEPLPYECDVSCIALRPVTLHSSLNNSRVKTKCHFWFFKSHESITSHPAQRPSCTLLYHLSVPSSPRMTCALNAYRYSRGRLWDLQATARRVVHCCAVDIGREEKPGKIYSGTAWSPLPNTHIIYFLLGYWPD